jgi:hypothetical protein
MNVEKERAAFEAWGRREADFEDEHLAQDRDGNYADDTTDCMWIGWKARAGCTADRESAR